MTLALAPLKRGERLLAEKTKAHRGAMLPQKASDRAGDLVVEHRAASAANHQQSLWGLASPCRTADPTDAGHAGRVPCWRTLGL